MVEALPEHYRDPRSHWTSTRISYFSIAYNTRLVPPDQVPKSYDDLLDPRWRGKLAWRIGSRQRHAAVHHDHPACPGRGQGDRVLPQARRAEGHQFRIGQRAHPRRSRHRRRVPDRAEHLRAPSADQPGEGRAGRLAGSWTRYRARPAR